VGHTTTTIAPINVGQNKRTNEMMLYVGISRAELAKPVNMADVITLAALRGGGVSRSTDYRENKNNKRVIQLPDLSS
jgi:hypothetical protein